MGNLAANWLTEGWIDFEYKKYMVLAYLQDVKKNFDEQKLYPFLQDLVFHYQNLSILKDNKDLMKENFPERLTTTDFEKLQLVYETIVQDDEIMKEIEDIMAFTIPEFKKFLAEGKDLYEYFESKMQIVPIGITPLRTDEGYLFVTEHMKKETKIYEYQVTLFQSPVDKYRGIHTRLLESRRLRLGTSYELMKVELAKEYRDKPNPAAYLLESQVYCPLNESLLPIAKRLLVKYISLT
ncbi:MAG: hypothetical protein SFY32_01150 [Bacteroidota bacterium]|nr:hypothetical protein [Bacteroidota bacterium]